ncbi:MAG TPA: STAS domain-containing protein [Luteimonas sp.]|nr:STAS domain-containing protein [Luteimonas sp.]
MGVASAAPSIDVVEAPDADAQGPRLRLRGRWTLQYANAVGQALRELASPPQALDARGVDRLDSAGVLQLLRYARRNGLDFDAFAFRPDHHAQVSAIEDVVDERPKKKRE